jgi:hypothetical protein
MQPIPPPMVDTTGIIPQHEPEIIAAIAAKHWRGDDEKVPTTSLQALTLCGVKIESRYRKAHEFELMRAMVLALTTLEREAVQLISCDSKASYVFDVSVRRGAWDALLAGIIGRRLEAVAVARNSGHNGIRVFSERDDCCVELDPNWLGDSEIEP